MVNICVIDINSFIIIRYGKIYRVTAIILIGLLLFFMIDKQFFMKQRVLRHRLWEHTGGAKVMDDMIGSENIIIKNDSITYTSDAYKTDTLLLVYQYFDTMKLLHIHSGKITKYSMKGANWTNYIGF